MTPQEALRAVLDLANRIEALAFEMKAPNAYTPQFVMLANEVRALRAALAQPEQEPWGYISHRSWKMPVFVEAENLEVSGLPFNNPNYTPVYKAPPQREWVGLTPEDKRIAGIPLYTDQISMSDAFDVIERILKEKNCAPDK